MWVLLLIAAAAIYFGAHDVALAQATTPNVTPPFQGLSTPWSKRLVADDVLPSHVLELPGVAPYTGQIKAVLHQMAPGVRAIDLFADAPEAT
jgi:hypothetical protein